MAISPQNNERKKVFYTGKLYGLTGMYVEQMDIQYIYQSDRSVIILKLLFKKEVMKRKTFWKFNSLTRKRTGRKH